MNEKPKERYIHMSVGVTKGADGKWYKTILGGTYNRGIQATKRFKKNIIEGLMKTGMTRKEAEKRVKEEFNKPVTK